MTYHQLKKNYTQKQTKRSRKENSRHDFHNIRLKKEGDRNVDQLSIKSRLCDHKRTLFSGQSPAIITHSTVPLDCIERVISQRGEMTTYQRSSTPRLASRIVLRKCVERAAAAGGFREPRETAGGTLSEAPSSSNASPSPSSWSITGRHQQRRGADDRDAKFG